MKETRSNFQSFKKVCQSRSRFCQMQIVPTSRNLITSFIKNGEKRPSKRLAHIKQSRLSIPENFIEADFSKISQFYFEQLSLHTWKPINLHEIKHEEETNTANPDDYLKTRILPISTNRGLIKDSEKKDCQEINKINLEEKKSEELQESKILCLKRKYISRTYDKNNLIENKIIERYKNLNVKSLKNSEVSSDSIHSNTKHKYFSTNFHCKTVVPAKVKELSYFEPILVNFKVIQNGIIIKTLEAQNTHFLSTNKVDINGKTTKDENMLNSNLLKPKNEEIVKYSFEKSRDKKRLRINLENKEIEKFINKKINKFEKSLDQRKILQNSKDKNRNLFFLVKNPEKSEVKKNVFLSKRSVNISNLVNLK